MMSGSIKLRIMNEDFNESDQKLISSVDLMHTMIIALFNSS